MKLSFECSGPQLQKNMEGSAEKFERAISATMNIMASMVEEEARARIAASGNFSDLAQALTTSVEGEGAVGNMRISMQISDPKLQLFATGGTITGDPLLWIPISGTDAEGTRAKDYGDQLFSVNRKSGGVPLLFSMADKLPKYFGIESVTIPKKFQLDDVVTSVMANFRDVFDDQMNKAE